MSGALIQSRNFISRQDNKLEQSCIYKKLMALSKDAHEKKGDHSSFSSNDNDGGAIADTIDSSDEENDTGDNKTKAQNPRSKSK